MLVRNCRAAERSDARTPTRYAHTRLTGWTLLAKSGRRSQPPAKARQIPDQGADWRRRHQGS